MRLFFISAAAVLAAALTAPAGAATEFCAASAFKVLPIHTPAAADGMDTVFGYQLRAETERTIGGMLNIYAGGDLYEVQFSNVHLTMKKQTIPGDGLTNDFSYPIFASNPLYFRFATPKKVDAIWVSAASTPDLKPVECPTMPVAPAMLVKPGLEKSEMTDADIRSGVSLHPAPALIQSHIDAGSCSTVFKDATMTKGVTPEYPDSARMMNLGPVTVFVKLALDSSGKVMNAWIVGSSGEPSIDFATLRAAQLSQYAPATFLCLPIPGTYRFRANFRSSP